MKLDDDICYCYHVPLRKLENFARRRTRPTVASQMSQCLGAGTGCGWCIPILKRIFEACQNDGGNVDKLVDMTPEEYAAARDVYRKSGQPRNEF